MVNISVIVPVYNSELYLKKCLDSLVNQSLSNIEIIVVDDCSTDNSRDIIKEYYKLHEDKIVPIFLDTNSRQGYIRNLGIQKAKGEYIAFVDSDDFIELDMFKETYEKAVEGNYDIVCFDFYEIRNHERKVNKLLYDSNITGAIDMDSRKKLFNSHGYFWTRIYKKSLLIENNIRFPEKIHYEDSPFNVLALLYANNVCKIDKAFYNYLIRENSSSNCINNERLYDRIVSLEYMFTEVKKRNLYNVYKELIDDKYIKMTYGNLVYICLNSFNKPNIEKMRSISKKLCSNIPEYKSNKFYKKLNNKQKFYMNLNNISPKALVCIDRADKNILKLKSKLYRIITNN